MNTMLETGCQSAVESRRARSQREVDILALQRRLQAVKDARQRRPDSLLKITPEDGDDWDGGLVGDLVRAARAVAGNGLLLDRFDRELIARRPWYGRYLDCVEDGWYGLTTETHELYNAMTVGALDGSQRDRMSATVNLLIRTSERLLDAVAPRVEAPKRGRARKPSAGEPPHANP